MNLSRDFLPCFQGSEVCIFASQFGRNDDCKHSLTYLDAVGRPADTRTKVQRIALRELLTALHKDYPTALIVGHNVLNPMKSCPCFDAATEYSDLQPR